MTKTLIKNIGKLFTGDINNPTSDANSILIEDGKIVEIGKDLSASEGMEVIDAKNSTVMPGLLDGHAHPVAGDWTPRQGAMSWIDPYVRAGVTGLVSVGAPHIPGKPKTAEGMMGLATTTKHCFDNVRPSNMKVYGGAYMIHEDAKKEDFEKLAAMGCGHTGEIGLGSANTVETAAEKVKWAQEAGIKVTIHRGASYLHGSNTIDIDTIVGLQPDIVCHATLGRLYPEETNRLFEETTANIEITRPQLGSILENSNILKVAIERDELHRITFGNDCPSGFGLFAHGIWELVTFATSFCKLDPAVAVSLATGNTADAFGLDEVGKVEVGRAADLVICDAPIGSDFEDASAALKEDIIPGVSLVLIDGKSVAEGNNVNTAPAKTKFERTC